MKYIIPFKRQCPKKKDAIHPNRHMMMVYENNNGFQVYCEACKKYEKTKRTEKEAIEDWNNGR